VTVRTVLQGLLTCQPCRGDPQEPTADPAPQVRGEERGAVGGWQVKYLTADEREAFRLTAQDGRLIDANGQPFNSRYAAGDATRSIFNAAGDNRFAIAVMDQDGNFYANNAALTGKFHHSSFFAGGRVFYGGNIQVTDGWLEAITRSSGHYKTGLQHLDQAVDSMQKQDVVHAFGVYRSVQGAPWQI